MQPLAARSDFRTRTIEASVAEVFAALRDPTRLARWWGPDGFSSTVHEFQFRPLGQWRLTLHGPDGQDYPNEYRVRRIEENHLLEVEHPSPDHHFVLTITLHAQGACTQVAWAQVFDTAEAFQPMAEFLAQANAQVLARLSAEVGHS